jgi:hypothetical protein
VTRFEPGREGAVATLPSQEPLVHRSELIWERLVAFATSRARDPLVWCSMPRFGSLLQARMALPHRVPSPLSREEVRKIQEAQLSVDKRGSPAGSGALIGKGCVFMARTRNHRRSQAPLHEWFGPVRRPGHAGLSSGRARKLGRRAASLADELVDCARSQRLELPIDSAAIHRRLQRNARLLAYWEDLLSREKPRVAVLGVVTAPSARAMILAAERAGIPTVYVPHTAVVSVPLLNTLPVDYAALRGEEEAAFLAGDGVDRARLDVVGNPMIAPEPPPEIDPQLTPVFAAGLEDSSRLGPLVEVIHEGLGGEVTVGRHPSADPEAVRGAFPAEWRVFDGRTYDLLRAGPPVVIQHSSGVALEALHLGIPVIELRYPGKATFYPLIREPYVRFASSSEEVAGAATAAAVDAGDTARREALIAWARGWSSPNGDEAGERAVALVERAASEGPRGRIWDPWGASSRTPGA